MNKDRLSNIYYFVDENNFVPVKEFIDSLTEKEQAKIYAYLNELKKQGNNLRRPMAGYLKKDIYELRPKNNRIFYFFQASLIIHCIRYKAFIFFYVNIQNIIKFTESYIFSRSLYIFFI